MAAHDRGRSSLKALNRPASDGAPRSCPYYPFIDVPDWWTQKSAKIGMYDVADKDSFERVPCDPYIQELRRWQKTLDRAGGCDPRVTETAGAACSFQKSRRLPTGMGEGSGRVQEAGRRLSEIWLGCKTDIRGGAENGDGGAWGHHHLLLLKQ